MAEVAVLPDSMTEFEWAKPCDSKGCDDAAAFYVLAAHTYERCPGELYYCQPHLDKWLKRCEEFITAPGQRCAKCKGAKPKSISEQAKVLPI